MSFTANFSRAAKIPMVAPAFTCTFLRTHLRQCLVHSPDPRVCQECVGTRLGGRRGQLVKPWFYYSRELGAVGTSRGASRLVPLLTTHANVLSFPRQTRRDYPNDQYAPIKAKADLLS